MIHLIFAEQDLMAKEAANKMIKKDFPQRNSFNYIAFDMNQATVKEAMRECELLSLGFTKKCVVMENCAFLKKGAKYKFAKEDKIDYLLDYLAHPNDSVELYLLVYGAIDTKSEAYELIVKNGGQIQEVPNLTPDSWNSYIVRYFKNRGSSIDLAAAKELNLRIGGDYGKFKNEAEKLLSYANGEDITLDTIEAMTTPYLEEDVYKMSNALTRGDNRKALEIYQGLKAVGAAEEVTLLGLLANQFRFMDQVLYLHSKGYSTAMIGQELGCKPIRAEITMRNLYGVSSQRLIRIMEQLYSTDRSILSGKVDAGYAFTLFLANFRL